MKSHGCPAKKSRANFSLTGLAWVSIQIKRYFTTRGASDHKLVENARSNGFLALQVG